MTHPHAPSPFLGTLLVLASAAAGASCSARASGPSSPEKAVPDAPGGEDARARELFAVHCAVCHGEDGAGEGEASSYLFPPPRDLTRGLFRLVGTREGVPSRQDLVQTLRRGMPGSAMPSWSWLPEEDLVRLADHVRRLAYGDHPSTDELPLEPLPTPTRAELEGASPALGEHLYAASCAPCHGLDGSGGEEPRWDEEGRLFWARDFTAGFLKGGATPEDLAHRILAGMPGSPMPGTDLDRTELAALVAHVRTLIPPGAEHRLVQERRGVRARRVAAPVPADQDDPRWSEADGVQVTLAPLKWRDASVRELSLSALHDGQSIAIRVRWADATRDTRVFSDVQRADAVALQFSNADAPPLFGMGSGDHPTNIWHWRSRRMEEVAGWMDLLEPPHVREGVRLEDVRVDVPLYHRLEGVPDVSREVERLHASGVAGTRDAERAPAAVRVSPRSTGEGWDVVFVRALAGASADDVTFDPGTAVQVSCAAWNGAAGDALGQKAISVWQELFLEE